MPDRRARIPGRLAERSPPEPEVTPRELASASASSGRAPSEHGAHRERRSTKLERPSKRRVATGGGNGIAVVPGAVLVRQAVASWIVELAVGRTSVNLAARLWSSRLSAVGSG